MQKAKKHRPFELFMLELKSQEEAKGRKFKSIADLRKFADRFWVQMNEEQRAPYKAKAEIAKQGAKGTAGKELSEFEVERRRSAANAILGRNQMKEMINEALEKNALEKMEMIFIAFEYFCITTGGTVIPAEMAVVRYSVKAGVMDQMHTLINPGCVPLGYARAMRDRAERYHHLPVPPNALGEKNYDTIAARLFEFLSKNGAHMPLVVTYPTDVSMVHRALQAIVEKFPTEKELFVGSLSELVYRLKRGDSQEVLTSEQIAAAILEQTKLIDNDVYQYAQTISCEYHGGQVFYMECTLSRCLRWAYSISDSCCKAMSVAVQPGKHNPPARDKLDQTADKMSTVSIDDTSFVSIFDHGKVIIKQSREGAVIVKGPVHGRKDLPKEAAGNAGGSSQPVEDIPRTSSRLQFVQAFINSTMNEAADENPGRSHGRGRGKWASYGRGVAASNPATSLYRGRGTLLRLAEAVSKPAEAVSEPAEVVSEPRESASEPDQAVSCSFKEDIPPLENATPMKRFIEEYYDRHSLW